MKTNLSLGSNYLIIPILFLLHINCSKPADQIYIDGEFTDWQHLSPIYQDEVGDQQPGHPDFGKIWMTNDSDYLYLRIEVGAEINMQNDNDLALFVDTDDDPRSGKQINGIGADLIYEFGKRQGVFFAESDTIHISHFAIGLVTIPTVTSNQFEIAIKRSSRLDNRSQLFPGQSIRLLIMEETVGGDVLPDKLGGIKYTFHEEVPGRQTPVSIKKRDPRSIRVMTNNTLSDGLFKPGQFAAISKIIQAVQPEIMVYQEIYNYDAEAVLQQVEKMIPSTDGQPWYSMKGGRDIVVVSRFPIEAGTSIDGNGAFLLDVRARFETRLLLIGTHLPCCGNNDGRRNEIDALMMFLRQSKNGTGEMPLAENTPIILLGDLNLVGDSQQLRTLLTGDIQDTVRFGPRMIPDWDGSGFADLMPYCTNIPFSFTWYDPNASFGPGRLDFMIYSDSVIEPVKKFVLFTPALPADTLARYDLSADDALNASDHLPVVADFVLKNN